MIPFYCFSENQVASFDVIIHIDSPKDVFKARAKFLAPRAEVRFIFWLGSRSSEGCICDISAKVFNCEEVNIAKARMLDSNQQINSW